ncbi:MAG TPA: heme o synthase [Candidatus Binatus sp.]|nr:heme o synthase [Candidatus Binatus sp.]
MSRLREAEEKKGQTLIPVPVRQVPRRVLAYTSLQAYFSLTKPRIMFLLDLTAIAAFLVAGNLIVPVRFLALLIAGSLVSGGAAALNCYLDRDLDGRMGRTKRRPIPTGEVQPVKGLEFGLLLVLIGTLVSLYFLPILATIFILLGAFIYVIYTKWLKPRTTLNIVLGGAAGSCAPLAGWAAATGQVGLAAGLMALLVFVWTPSHFWGLAMRSVDDYSRAGIPMLPVVVGEKKAAQYIAANTFLLIPLSLSFFPLKVFGLIYLIVAGSLGLWLLIVDLKLVMDPSKSRAWTAFKVSSPYLAVVFLAMVLDKIV